METVKVKYLNDQGEPTGRSYSYFTEEPLALGDIVQVPVRDDHSTKAQVVEINVPDFEIAAFRDRVKTIPSGSKRPPTQAEDFIPTTEVQFPEAETPPVAQVASLFDQKGPRRCDVEHLRDYPECFEECGKYECDGEPVPPPGANHGEPTTPRELEPEPGPTQETPPDTFPTEEEFTTENLDALTTWPPALTVIGHKCGPPTASALFTLYQQAAGLLDFAKKRVITTNEDLKPATDDLAIILTCRKEMEARKTEIVGPMRAELDRFYQAFNDLMAPVLEAEKLTKSKVSAFEADQRQKAADAQRIEDEKARLAREEAALNGTGEITVPLGTAEAPPPVPERTRTDMGTMSGRDNWKAKVVDFAALPDEFKLADMSALNAKAKSSKGTAEIPGVEFYNDRIYQVRTKS